MALTCCVGLEHERIALGVVIASGAAAVEGGHAAERVPGEVIAVVIDAISVHV